MEKTPYENSPFETPGGRPVIAVIGEVFSEDEIVLMEMAATELNLTLEQPRYQVVYDKANCFNANGTRIPQGHYRVMLQGDWIEDKDLTPFWERVVELRDDSQAL